MIKSFYCNWWRDSKASFLSLHIMVFTMLFLAIWTSIYPPTPHVFTMQEKMHLCVLQEEPQFIVVESYDAFIKGDCIDVVNSYLSNGSKIVDTTSDRRGDIQSYVLEK